MDTSITLRSSLTQAANAEVKTDTKTPENGVDENAVVVKGCIRYPGVLQSDHDEPVAAKPAPRLF